jgi:hypothetical protein
VFINKETDYGKSRQTTQGTEKTQKTAGSKTGALSKGTKPTQPWAFFFTLPFRKSVHPRGSGRAGRRDGIIARESLLWTPLTLPSELQAVTESTPNTHRTFAICRETR